MKIIKNCIYTVLTIIIVFASIKIHEGYEIYKIAINNISIKEQVYKIQENPNYTKYADLPQDYINAVIAVEDRRFFSHKGIDIISIIRAIFIDIKNLKLEEGGSTITQQLAKNTYFTQEKKISRKIAEIFMAFEYEKNLTKEEIFELYVNTSYFGDGYYCVKDASQGYFDKLPKEMNLYESTLLAGIPNAPSVYAPTKNPDLAKQRQAQVLRKMVSQKYLTQEQANQIIQVDE